MSGFVGRLVEVRKGTTTGVLIAGVRTKSVTINNEPIDITTDDSAGFRELLDVSGERHLDISVEGLTQNNTLLGIAVGGTSLIDEFSIVFPGTPNVDAAVVVRGDFRINNLQFGAEYADAVTFTAELQSTGSFAVDP
jgi:TP901-1 family phage major tail protein